MPIDPIKESKLAQNTRNLTRPVHPILFLVGPHDIRQSIPLCHPERTGGAICQLCARGHPGVRRLACSGAPTHTAAPSGSDPKANAVLCGAGPALREKSGPCRSIQPNPLVYRPS